jgi:hypothetical protein
MMKFLEIYEMLFQVAIGDILRKINYNYETDNKTSSKQI